MIRLSLLILFCVAIFGCSGDPVNIEIVEYKVYDVPAKTQVSIKAVLTDTLFTEKDVKSIVNILYERAKSRKFKYHSVPTHIFVYIYRNKDQMERAEWIAMRSKILKDESPVEVR